LITSIYKATLGSKFYVPLEYEILISFVPIDNSQNSLFSEGNDGYLRLRAALVKEIDEEEFSDESTIIIERVKEEEEI